jgi:hypothetical protein
MMQSLRWSRFISGTLLILCLGWSPALADYDPEKGIYFQAMLGAASYSHLSFAQQSTTDPSVEAESEITWMPVLGLCAGVPLLQKSVTLGLEGGALFSWMSDSVTAVGGGGTINVHIKNELYLVDLFFGPYLSADLGKSARIYVGAGPLWMIGQYDKRSDEDVSESETVREHGSSTASAVGAYARTGIEFKLNDGSWMGLGVRAFQSRLDFDNVSEKTDVKGLQLLITYTQGI